LERAINNLFTLSQDLPLIIAVGRCNAAFLTTSRICVYDILQMFHSAKLGKEKGTLSEIDIAMILPDQT